MRWAARQAGDHPLRRTQPRAGRRPEGRHVRDWPLPAAVTLALRASTRWLKVLISVRASVDKTDHALPKRHRDSSGVATGYAGVASPIG